MGQLNHWVILNHCLSHFLDIIYRYGIYLLNMEFDMGNFKAVCAGYHFLRSLKSNPPTPPYRKQ